MGHRENENADKNVGTLKMLTGWDTGTIKMQTGWDTGTPKMRTIWDTGTLIMRTKMLGHRDTKNADFCLRLFFSVWNTQNKD